MRNNISPGDKNSPKGLTPLLESARRSLENLFFAACDAPSHRESPNPYAPLIVPPTTAKRYCFSPEVELRIARLLPLLSRTETLETLYLGPSPLLLDFARRMEAEFSIPQTVQFSSIAQLAFMELAALPKKLSIDDANRSELNRFVRDFRQSFQSADSLPGWYIDPQQEMPFAGDRRIASEEPSSEESSEAAETNYDESSRESLNVSKRSLELHCRFENFQRMFKEALPEEVGMLRQSVKLLWSAVANDYQFVLSIAEVPVPGLVGRKMITSKLYSSYEALAGADQFVLDYLGPRNREKVESRYCN